MSCDMAYYDDYMRDVTRSSPVWYTELWKQDNVVLSGPHACPLHIGPTAGVVTEDSVSCEPVRATSVRDRQQISLLHRDGIVVPQNEDPMHLYADDNFYICLHAACLRIAKRVMEGSLNAHIRTVGDLWLTLERRSTKVVAASPATGVPFLPPIPVSPPERRPPTGPLVLGSDRYFVGDHFAIWREQEYGDDWDGVDGHDISWFHVDPEYIPDLTPAILSNMEECTPNLTSEFGDSFEKLPQEIIDTILSLIPQRPMPLECNHLISQSYWHQIFLQVPFLWDIDVDLVNAKLHTAVTSDKLWNWEKLVRQLMTPMDVSQGYSGDNPRPKPYRLVGLKVPRGLQNRRRIWQILEEMYPNDVRVDGTEAGQRWPSYRPWEQLRMAESGPG